MIANRKDLRCAAAYNAARTLERTFREIPADVVDDVILVDDASTDAHFGWQRTWVFCGQA